MYFLFIPSLVALALCIGGSTVNVIYARLSNGAS